MKNIKLYETYASEYDRGLFNTSGNNLINLVSYDEENFIFESEKINYYTKYLKSPVKSDTREIQQFLIDLGIKSVDGKGGEKEIKKDGDLGIETSSAIFSFLYGKNDMKVPPYKDPQKKTLKDLQKKLGIKENGKVGKDTLDAISKELNKSLIEKIKKEAEKEKKSDKDSLFSSVIQQAINKIEKWKNYKKEIEEKYQKGWNPKGESLRYGNTIRNIMYGYTSPYESTFQSRQTFYRQIHELLYQNPNKEAKDAIKSFGLNPIHSNWFQAAASVNQANALGAADNINLWFMTDDTEAMLRHCGVELLKRNIVTAKEMLLGTLNKSFVNAKGKTVKLDKSSEGQVLDNRLVEYEQSELNKIMEAYKKKVGIKKWDPMISGINFSFGLPAAPDMISNVIKKFFPDKSSSSSSSKSVLQSITDFFVNPVEYVSGGISKMISHKFNIDSYDNRVTLGKGCVSQIYHGAGKTDGINLS